MPGIDVGSYKFNACCRILIKDRWLFIVSLQCSRQLLNVQFWYRDLYSVPQSDPFILPYRLGSLVMVPGECPGGFHLVKKIPSREVPGKNYVDGEIPRASLSHTGHFYFN